MGFQGWVRFSPDSRLGSASPDFGAVSRSCSTCCLLLRSSCNSCCFGTGKIGIGKQPGWSSGNVRMQKSREGCISHSCSHSHSRLTPLSQCTQYHLSGIPSGIYLGSFPVFPAPAQGELDLGKNWEQLSQDPRVLRNPWDLLGKHRRFPKAPPGPGFADPNSDF